MLPWAARKVLPEDGGIYLIYDEIGLVYIGVTNNLRHRLHTHHHRPTFDGLIRAHVAYVLMDDSIERVRLERMLIRQHRPRLNRVGNPGHPSRPVGPVVVVNLPLERDLLAQVDDFRFTHRFPSRIAAMKWLIASRLEEKPTPKKEDVVQYSRLAS